jgi:3D (Asp-Asp-Asp) domain-containing protein
MNVHSHIYRRIPERRIGESPWQHRHVPIRGIAAATAFVARRTAAVARRSAAVALLGAALVACGGSVEAQPDATPAPDAHAVELPPPGAVRGSFQLTYYWVTAEDDFSGAADTQIYDATCAPIATVPAKFVDALNLEGTGRLADGRVINDAGACGCGKSRCYQQVDAQHPWGMGVQDRALTPFRSIAVDPKVIPYGTGLYIPELDGVTMADGLGGSFVHDGCVLAADTGGGIVGNHIDFFSATHAGYTALDSKLKLDHVTVRDGGARCPSM